MLPRAPLRYHERHAAMLMITPPSAAMMIFFFFSVATAAIDAVFAADARLLADFRRASRCFAFYAFSPRYFLLIAAA